MNNKTLWGIVAVIVIILGIYFVSTMSSNAPSTSSSTEENQNQTADAGGRVVFSVTDAAVDMAAISQINMKINEIDVHSAASGWMTVSTTPETYSLLMLNAKNESDLLADATLAAGSYDQVRLTVDSVAVIGKNGTSKPAKLPSGELKINTNLIVNADKTTSANFDFMASKSLHTTGSGDYIFAPVVKTTTKSNADVSISAGNAVTVTNGNLDSSSSAGMDIDGSVKADFELDIDTKLNVDSNNKIIKLNGLLK